MQRTTTTKIPIVRLSIGGKYKQSRYHFYVIKENVFDIINRFFVIEKAKTFIKSNEEKQHQIDLTASNLWTNVNGFFWLVYFSFQLKRILSLTCRNNGNFSLFDVYSFHFVSLLTSNDFWSVDNQKKVFKSCFSCCCCVLIFFSKIVWKASLLRCYQSVNRLFMNVRSLLYFERCSRRSADTRNAKLKENNKNKHTQRGMANVNFNQNLNRFILFVCLTLIRILRRAASERNARIQHTERQWKMSKKYN